VTTVARAGGVLVVLSAAVAAQIPEPSSSASARATAERSAPAVRTIDKTTIGYADVQPLSEVLRPHLPAALRGVPPDELDAAWRVWAIARDAAIRARVARGDEDSLVNLWLFGTSFTDLPPARPRDLGTQGVGTRADVVSGRLDDLLDAVRSPGTSQRLRWAGGVLAARGIDPRTSAGRARARGMLDAIWKRMLAEDADYARVLEAPNSETDPLAWMARYASLYSDRGLSSDTSILSSFAIDAALEALATSGLIAPGAIRRAAVIGPGLDVINKADGHDFYPEQTIQPFALIDSLIRHRLSPAGGLSVTTFDVSARVNRHLTDARARAGTESYVLHLPLSDAERWSPALVRYWEQAGSRIGESARAARPPRSAGNVRVRAVRVRPDVVASVTPRDLNIVLERLDLSGADEGFDLVVATNVFVYYDRFEQALALVNVGRMLRTGGSLLSNQAVSPVPPMQSAVGHEKVVYSDRQLDHVFWYRR
jgi:hypothetical protein